jgi:16S rRNA (guanine(527)-N(7))-methyltransferase RsmG
VKAERIADLLRPFLDGDLSPPQLDQISTYIDLLLRWNQRVNLTAIRDPEEIVTRHFGESFFAARHLFPCGADTPVREAGSPPASPDPSCHSDARAQRAKEESAGSQNAQSKSNIPPIPTSQVLANHQGATTNDFAAQQATTKKTASGDRQTSPRLLDLGSGAGFPGLPIKIWSPPTPVTLIESRQKKVAFLREVIRALTLTGIDVFAGRAEDFPPGGATIVTLRAVERFDQALPAAAARLNPGGCLALLISQPQAQIAGRLPSFQWQPPVPIPHSSSRIFFLGYKTS